MLHYLGYDENGDVLIGRSRFADDPTSDIEGLHSISASKNYFQKRNRLEKSDALIFIGEKTYIPSIADGIQASIQHIPVFANLAEIDGADGFSACIVLGR